MRGPDGLGPSHVSGQWSRTATSRGTASSPQSACEMPRSQRPGHQRGSQSDPGPAWVLDGFCPSPKGTTLLLRDHLAVTKALFSRPSRSGPKSVGLAARSRPLAEVHTRQEFATEAPDALQLRTGAPGAAWATLAGGLGLEGVELRPQPPGRTGPGAGPCSHGPPAG